ncbi:MAG: SusD/RagB family nutrient-binding outer membrane lipoprotein, partial [Schleiferiaceae bacterium]
LKADIAVLGGDNGLGSYDLLYGGNSDGWKKFASSLLLRLAVRVADADAASATDWGTYAITAGVILTPGDDAKLDYASAPPHANPLWDQFVQSGRSDFIAANTLGDVMNTLNDPRRAIYFRNNNADGSVNGAPYGLSSSYALFSQPGDILEDPTLAHNLLDHVEVHFLLADAAARGFTIPGATAQGLYEAAVSASILAWGGSAAEAAAYLQETGVAWDAAAWRNRIGTQKWIALFTRGNEAWAAQRQYNLYMNQAAEAGRVTPKRMSYGVDEYALNNANVTAAGARYNGDSDTAPIFWDVQ